jgi:hypothetical protein
MDPVLLDELVLQILAFLPTFEDRWLASLVNWQWRRAYRVLLRPANDALASRSLVPVSMSLRGQCGPQVVVTARYKFLPSYMTLRFALRGAPVLASFRVSPQCDFILVEFKFDQWVRIERVVVQGAAEWYLTSPGYSFFWNVDTVPGDIFEQVSFGFVRITLMNTSPEYLHYDSSFPFLPSIPWDPALARRLWNFPAFVATRAQLERDNAAWMNREPISPSPQ